MRVTSIPIHPKVDLGTRIAFIGKGPDKEASFILQTTKPLTDIDIDELKKLGCTEVAPLTESMYSISTKLGVLYQIADLNFVHYVELKKTKAMN